MTRTRDDRAGASLALLLVLLALGLAGSTGRRSAEPPPDPGKGPFLAALGDVSRPGVHAFREGSVTLRDLAARAAGDGDDLDLSGLPEGIVLASGSKVVFRRESGGGASWRTARMDGFQCMTLGVPVSLNRASLEDLTALPGVGPSLAGAVVEHRKRTKGFEREEDLLKVHGIGHGLLEGMRPYVTVP